MTVQAEREHRATDTSADSAGTQGRRVTGSRKLQVILVLPFVAALSVLVLTPAVFSVVQAFFSGAVGVPGTSFTLEFITRVYGTSSFLRPILNTFLLSGSVALLSAVAGTGFAWLIARTDIRAKRLIEVLLICPLILSPFVLGIAWLMLGSSRAGLVNQVFRSVTGADGGLFDITQFPGMVFVLTTSHLPYAYLFVVAALRNIDGSMEDASRMNGASELATTRRVTLPLVAPAILASFLFVFVATASTFSVPVLYGHLSGFRVVASEIYQYTAVVGDQGIAAAAGTVTLIITIGGLALYRRATRAGDRYVTVAGRGGGAAQPVRLGAGKVVAAIVVAVYVLLSTVLPLGALLIASLAGSVRLDRLSLANLSLTEFETIFSSAAFHQALRTTAIVAIAAPLLTLVIALVLARVNLRTQLPFRRYMDYVATIPVAIPGLLFGLGALWATIGTPLYGTIILLIVVYAGRYLPEVYRISSNGVLQLDRSMEEASMMCGASASRTSARVVAPLLTPALLSGFVVASIFVLREVPTAVMLTTPQTQLLSVYTWEFAFLGDFSKASALSLFQLVLYLLLLVVARYLFRVRSVLPGSRSAVAQGGDR